MKQYIYTLLTAACLGASAGYAAENKAITIDFRHGMPQDLTLIDADGLTPSPDVEYMGFSVGKPWVAYDVEDTGEKVACATSWYSPAGQAQDWMILPALDVDPYHPILKWEARSVDGNLRDGYAVYISSTAETPEEFLKEEPVFSTQGETKEWASHSVALDKYAGQKVRIAFLHNAYDCHTLLLRDIFAGSPDPVDVQITFKAVQPAGVGIPVTCKAVSGLDTPITSLTAGYTWKGEQHTVELTGLNIPAYGEYEFTIPGEIVLEKESIEPLDIWVECDGIRSSRQFSISNFSRKIVAEEATGTWCAYCVSGIYMMEKMKAEYPDDFIGIAVHSSDPMEIPDYVVSMGGSGYPHVDVNRTQGYHPLDFLEDVDRYLNQEAMVGVRAQVSVEGNHVNVKSSTYFDTDYPRSFYNLAYVVVENDVQDDTYYQKNAYAGGSLGPCGGFEDLPDMILGPDIYFQDVARIIVDETYGVPGSVPDGIKAGIPSVHYYDFELPGEIMNLENCEFITLVLDTRNYAILNAERIPLISKPGSVEGVPTQEAGVRVTANGSVVTVCGDAPVQQVDLYAPDGRLLKSVKANALNLQVEVDYTGPAVWRVRTAEASSTGKIILR